VTVYNIVVVPISIGTVKVAINTLNISTNLATTNYTKR
jgi:hypothetical protein